MGDVRKIVVTGGAGFIGSKVAALFVREGWQVLVVDDLSRGKRENVPTGASFFPLDLRGAAAADLVLRERPEVICHHAAQIDVRLSMSDPRHDAEVNLIGLLNLMQAAVKSGSVRHVIFASSGATYGDGAPVPTPEATPPRPNSIYGAAKAASEIYLNVYRTSHGIPFAALRYANVYGPGQDPHGEAGVVAIFGGRLLNGEQCTIYGDGKQRRDYVFVEDVARANLLAAERRFDGALNISTGIQTDVNTLYAELALAAGSQLKASDAPARPGEQAASCLDPTAADKALGWRPKVGLAEGIKASVDSMRAKG